MKPAKPSTISANLLALMGLASWAKFSRPSGTELGNGVLTHAF